MPETATRTPLPGLGRHAGIPASSGAWDARALDTQGATGVPEIRRTWGVLTERIRLNSG